MAKHSYTTDERRSFAEHINRTLKGDQDLRTILPLNPESDALFTAVGDGVLLIKWLNKLKPGIIPDKVIQLHPRNRFERLQNLSAVLTAARELGFNIVNVGPEDIIDQKYHLVLGLIWQIVRFELLSKVTVNQHPEIVALMEPNEEVNTFLDLTPEVNLLRWFNYHLKRKGSPRRVTNFSSDLADSENYIVLLNSIAPDLCSLEALHEGDVNVRAQRCLENAEKIGCRQFLTPPDIVNGNWKLNLAFIANLFNKQSGIPFEPAFEERLRQINQALQQRSSQPVSSPPVVAAQRTATPNDDLVRKAAEEVERLRREEAEAQRRREEEEARQRALKQKAEEEARIRETREREARWREAEQRRLAEEEARQRASHWQQPQGSFGGPPPPISAQPSFSIDPFSSMTYNTPPVAPAPAPYGTASSYLPSMAPPPLAPAPSGYGFGAPPAPYGMASGYPPPGYGAPVPYTSPYTSIPVGGGGRVPISRVKLMIQEARSLPKKDFFGLAASDPYCTVEVRGNIQKTRKCNSTTRPVWYEEFIFMNVNPSDRIIISLWDSDAFKKDDFMGQVILNYEDLVTPQEKWHRICSRHGHSDRVSGELKLSVTPTY